MSFERAKNLALALMRLGVSKSGVDYLFRNFTYDQIEKQLEYLPYRKAKRPEAFIIDAVRHNYSAPKDLFHASNKAQPAKPGSSLDQSAERIARRAVADAQGHGATGDPGSPETDKWVESTAPTGDYHLPSSDETDGTQE